jgi:hypothetical protein
MPEPKGRKNKRDRDRDRRRSRPPVEGGADGPPADEDSAEAGVRRNTARRVQEATVAQAVALPMPSPTARVTGVMLALITALLAATMVYNGVTGDAAGIDLAFRVGAGAFLILLAAAITLLSLSPNTVRRLIRRER